MILYLDLAAMHASLARTMNISVEVDGVSSSTAEWYCTLTGFNTQYASSSLLIAVACLATDIFLQALFSLDTKRVEVVYPLLIFLSPALYCWIPFYFNAYGEAGAWCWIKDKNEECGTFKEGIYLRFSLLYVPYFVIFPILFVLLLITLCVLYRRRHDYEAPFDPHVTRMRRVVRSEIKRNLLYPLLVIILNIFPVAVRIHELARPNDNIFGLWIVNSLIAPMEGAVIALIFTVDPDTKKRLRYSELRAAFLMLCCDRGSRQVEEYPAKLKWSSDSYKQPSSNPLITESTYGSLETSTD